MGCYRTTGVSGHSFPRYLHYCKYHNLHDLNMELHISKQMDCVIRLKGKFDLKFETQIFLLPKRNSSLTSQIFSSCSKMLVTPGNKGLPWNISIKMQPAPLAKEIRVNRPFQGNQTCETELLAFPLPGNILGTVK